MDLMLSGYTVLDLAQEGTTLCGKVLADLGATVIKVEKPGGDPTRSRGPFFHDIVDGEKSLYWWAYNASKKSITLDIETADGKDIFGKLTATADVIIESYVPGYMDGVGLGYAALSRINPRIIVTSITPFGQDGPYRDRPASDLTLTSMGGLTYITGYTDRAPVRISFPQAELTAGVEAASASLIALYYREASGEGQHVDVSSYQCQIVDPLNSIPWWELSGFNVPRDGIYRVSLGESSRIRYRWPCKDGFVILLIYGGTTGAKANKAMVEWMDSEGMASDYIRGIDWDAFEQLGAFQDRQNVVEDAVEKFLLTHTKQELFDGAVKRGILLGPISTVGEVLENPQLKARDFWVEVDHPDLGTSIPYPGAFVRGSAPVCRPLQRAPLIGEHNEDIYCGQLGISQEDLVILRRHNVI